MHNCSSTHRVCRRHISSFFGLDKTILTLILSRQGHISSTPCHQSSEARVKTPLAGSLAYCIPSIMSMSTLGSHVNNVIALFPRKILYHVESQTNQTGVHKVSPFLQNCLEPSSHGQHMVMIIIIIGCHVMSPCHFKLLSFSLNMCQRSRKSWNYITFTTMMSHLTPPPLLLLN